MFDVCLESKYIQSSPLSYGTVVCIIKKCNKEEQQENKKKTRRLQLPRHNEDSRESMEWQKIKRVALALVGKVPPVSSQVLSWN